MMTPTNSNPAPVSDGENGGVPVKKADLLQRVLARLIDLLIFAAFCSLYPIGMLAGFLYLLIADGLMGGRSIGKRIIGLYVVQFDTYEPAGYRESIIRNADIALLGLFTVIPLLGPILLFTVGLIIVVVETYLIARNEFGQRAGDILAGTEVMEWPRTIPGMNPSPLPEEAASPSTPDNEEKA